MLEFGDYKVADPDALETPAMVVFEAKVDGNIAALCDLVGGGQNLVVHVKTHKSEAVTRKQIVAGVAGFKCATLKELEMVLDAGASFAILSYPQVQKLKVERLGDLAAAHPEDAVCVLASNRQHLDVLSKVASERSRPLSVMIDLDVGMHRTGLAPREPAEAVYAAVDADSHLVAAGLHVYDGHEHMSDPQAREAAARRHIEDVRKLKDRLEAAGRKVPRVVGGGSFSFPYYARTDGMMGSPGTCIYWDTGYARQMPDMPFEYAALILTQVVDVHPDHKTITTDLGYKAICGDPPVNRRARLLGAEDATLLLQNEEHGVFHWDAEPPAVGTYFLAVPGHVCPTTIRYPGSYVLDPTGAVVDYYPHTARDRQ